MYISGNDPGVYVTVQKQVWEANQSPNPTEPNRGLRWPMSPITALLEPIDMGNLMSWLWVYRLSLGLVSEPVRIWSLSSVLNRICKSCLQSSQVG